MAIDRLRFACLPSKASHERGHFDHDAQLGVDRALINELGTCRFLETATNVNREVWGGNRTKHGAWTWSRLMTVLATARQQSLDTLSVLTNLARQPAPSLAFPIP